MTTSDRSIIKTTFTNAWTRKLKKLSPDTFLVTKLSVLKNLWHSSIWQTPEIKHESQIRLSFLLSIFFLRKNRPAQKFLTISLLRSITSPVFHHNWPTSTRMGDEIIDTVRDRFRTRQRHIREIREMAENHDQLARAFNGKRLGPRGTSLSKFKKTYLVYTILASHRPLSDSLHHRAKALQTERQTETDKTSLELR